MRTYVRTAVTLDTVLRLPDRDIYRDTALLVCGGAGRGRAVYIVLERGYREGISFLCIHLRLDILYKINHVFSSVFTYMRNGQTFVSSALPAVRNCYFYNLLRACVNGVIVHLNDLVALSSVGRLCSLLHQVDGFLFRNDGCQLEERRLQHGIDTSAKSDLLTDLDTVDGVELDAVVCDKRLYLSRKMLVQSFCVPWAVQKEGTAVYQLLYHVVLVNIRRIVACNKVRLADQVGGLDRGFTKTQVGHGHAA